MSKPTVISMTITGIPITIEGTLHLVDALVSVDFAELAAMRANRAAFNKDKISRWLNGAILVKASNLRSNQT